MLMAIVFGFIFKSPLNEYAPYILSGLIAWDVISSSFIGGAAAIIASEQYIRQINYPITIYSLKAAIVTMVTFLIAVISLCIWTMFINPLNVLLGLLTLPLTALVYLIISWAIITFSSIINTKYRDYPQVIALIMQAVWYLSPVFFRKEMFLSNPLLSILFYYNPINHILELIRAPFLYGRIPSMANYMISVLFAFFWAIIAFLTYRHYKKDIIFYI
jgi:lipopolysaccharide transport system permease protein